MPLPTIPDFSAAPSADLINQANDQVLQVIGGVGPLGARAGAIAADNIDAAARFSNDQKAEARTPVCVVVSETIAWATPADVDLAIEELVWQPNGMYGLANGFKGEIVLRFDRTEMARLPVPCPLEKEQMLSVKVNRAQRYPVELVLRAGQIPSFFTVAVDPYNEFVGHVYLHGTMLHRR